MNSYSLNGIAFKKPYGLGLEHQNAVLDEMYSTIQDMRCYNKHKELQNSLQIFQKGILMSITSMKALYTKMEQKFGYKYIRTYCLNQDYLENFYSQMRTSNRNGANYHPTPVECLYNIKAIILGKNPGLAVHMHCNTIEREPEEYASAIFNKVLSDAVPDSGPCDISSDDMITEFLEEYSEDIPEQLQVEYSEDMPEQFREEYSEHMPEESIEDYSHDFNTTKAIFEDYVIDLTIERLEGDTRNKIHNTADMTVEFIDDLSNEMTMNETGTTSTLTEDGLEYIAGRISWKFQNKNPDYSKSRRESLPSFLTDHTYAKREVFSSSWIDNISYGGLTKPTEQVLEWVYLLEKEFLNVQGEFNNRINIKQQLIQTMEFNCQDVPKEIIQLFVRSRIYMRCNYLNKKRVEEALLKNIDMRKLRALKRTGDLVNDSTRSKIKKMKKTVL